MLYPCIVNVVISCWKSGAYGFVICRDGTDMCFVLGSGWKHLDLEQYCISGLTGDSWASLRISCLRFLLFGTTIMFSKYTTPSLSRVKYLALPLAMFALMYRIPRARFCAALI